MDSQTADDKVCECFGKTDAGLLRLTSAPRDQRLFWSSGSLVWRKSGNSPTACCARSSPVPCRRNSPASSADKHPATGSDAADEDSGLEERALASPEARERRNNLNLTPVRKHIRLPDVSHYPVQAVSGLGMKELVRIATAREESRQAENAPGGESLWCSQVMQTFFCKKKKYSVFGFWNRDTSNDNCSSFGWFY